MYRSRSKSSFRKTIATAFSVVTLLTVAATSSLAAETADESETFKPMIGINMDVEAGKPKTFRILPDYVNAITKAGGIPVVIAPMPEAQLTELLNDWMA